MKELALNDMKDAKKIIVGKKKKEAENEHKYLKIFWNNWN